MVGLCINKRHAKVRSLIVIFTMMLSLACRAELSPDEMARLEESCQPHQRHFSLSPLLPMDSCIVIDSYHTHAHNYQAMEARHEQSKSLVIDRMALLEAVLIELDYLSTGFQHGTLGFPAAMNQHTRGVLTKNMVARDLLLLHQLLREVEITAQLGINHQSRILQTLVQVAEGLGSFLYSYDMMTNPCPSDGSESCPSLLFMAPVLWTDIIYRLDSIQPLGSENFDKIEPFLNNMLEAHAQASFGIPLYLFVYDPRTLDRHSGRNLPMDYADQNYQQILTAWGMDTDWHRSEHSAASLKMWGYMRKDANFQFSMVARIAYSEDAHHYAEQAKQRLNALIATYGKHPRIPKLATLPSYHAEMIYSSVQRGQIEQVINMINMVGKQGPSPAETYIARYQRFSLD